MDDAERGVAVAHRSGHDPQRDEIVDLLEIDLLLELLMDAEQALDPAVDLDDQDLRFLELRGDRLAELLDHSLGDAPSRLHRWRSDS